MSRLAQATAVVVFATMAAASLLSLAAAETGEVTETACRMAPCFMALF